jgi:uncharacterized lipoprotein YajG
VRKGLLTNEEVLEEIKAVRREMEEKRRGVKEDVVSKLTMNIPSKLIVWMQRENSRLKTGGSRVAGSFLLAVLILSGCGLSKDYITIAYHRQENVKKIEGADRVNVEVLGVDERTNKDNVGKKGSEYKMLAPIIAQNDLAETIANAIRTELTNRGFRSNGESVVVVAELAKFYNEFKHGDAVAEVIMNVEIKEVDGSIIFSEIITGEGTEGATWRSGSNAKIALDGALKNAVEKLFDDTAFIEAIFQAAES